MTNYWRTAGLTSEYSFYLKIQLIIKLFFHIHSYLRYSSIAARVVRSALKPEHKTDPNRGMTWIKQTSLDVPAQKGGTEEEGLL